MGFSLITNHCVMHFSILLKKLCGVASDKWEVARLWPVTVCSAPFFRNAFISWQATDYNEDNTLKSYFSLSQVHFPGATHFSPFKIFWVVGLIKTSSAAASGLEIQITDNVLNSVISGFEIHSKSLDSVSFKIIEKRQRKMKWHFWDFSVLKCNI